MAGEWWDHRQCEVLFQRQIDPATQTKNGIAATSTTADEGGKRLAMRHTNKSENNHVTFFTRFGGRLRHESPHSHLLDLFLSLLLPRECELSQSRFVNHGHRPEGNRQLLGLGMLFSERLVHGVQVIQHLQLLFHGHGLHDFQRPHWLAWGLCAF